MQMVSAGHQASDDETRSPSDCFVKFPPKAEERYIPEPCRQTREGRAGTTGLRSETPLDQRGGARCCLNARISGVQVSAGPFWYWPYNLLLTLSAAGDEQRQTLLRVLRLRHHHRRQAEALAD